MKHAASYLFALAMCLSIFPTLLQAQCPLGSTALDILVQPDQNIESDNTRWEITDGSGEVILFGQADTSLCLSQLDCYEFTIYDDFGDGLSGSAGGYFSVSYAGGIVASGTDFGFSLSAIFGEGCEPGSSCFSSIDVELDQEYTVEDGESWYRFEPTEQAIYELTACGFTNSCNTSIWVYDRCLGLSGTDDVEESIIYNDDHCEKDQAQISSILYPGQTYWIRVGDFEDDCVEESFQWTITSAGPIMGCTDPASCNYDPLATVNDGSCLYSPHPNCPSGPDLIVAPGVLASSIYPTTIGNNDACYVNEGCLQGYGLRQILRFRTHIKNVGTEDYVIGSPDPDSGQFEFDACHGHWHQEGYAEYRVYDEQGNALPIGFKNGFCVLDLECSGGGTPTYNCGYMGISAGCGDYYSSGLACQWIDVTDLPDGIYTMVIVVNWDRDPDLFGRDELSYDNNWDQICFALSRNESGNHNIEVLGDCPLFVDCAGVIQGDTQLDCSGICGGDDKAGDVNSNGLYDYGDVNQYINGILDSTMPHNSCTELTGDQQIDLEDAAWLNECILTEDNADGHTSHSHSCQLPTFGIDNPNQAAEFSLLFHDPEEQYLLVSIQNPGVEIVATHLKFDGLTVTGADYLGPAYDGFLFTRPDGQIISYSFALSALTRYSTPQPFLQVNYSEINEENFCLAEVYTTINRQLERVNGYVGAASCLADIEECSPTSPFDQDGDGVCDDEDVCDYGDDNIDTDEDGIPDDCDFCPDSALNDQDGNGYCDEYEDCIDPTTVDDCKQYSLFIQFDNNPDELRFYIIHQEEGLVYDHTDIIIGGPNTSGTYTFCLDDGFYFFAIEDAGADGLCCLNGQGEYRFTRVDDGEVLSAGSNFGEEKRLYFAVDGVVDADGDGTCDYLDACPLESEEEDTDGDGVLDCNDLCPGADDNLDSDNDGVPDGCDICPGQPDVDDDGDGVCNMDDVCPGGDDMADADGDGTPDQCDVCPNSATDDSDNDGICDDLDGCVGMDDALFCDDFRLILVFDRFSEETSWEIVDEEGMVVMEHELYPASVEETTIEEEFCLPSGNYTLRVLDTYGDGICCGYGEGSYQLIRVASNTLMAEGGDFDNVDETNFTATSTAFPDEDNDGVCDLADICPGSDDMLDEDEDGVPDGCDICPGSDDTVDLDMDGVPDGCDASCAPPGSIDIILNPAPIDERYSTGQEVEICVTINIWDGNSAGTIEWLHAVTFNLGAGWDYNSITPNPPASCDGNGEWGWYESWTSCNTGTEFGPGFAYDSNAGIGCDGAENDGDPGNNWGDGANGCSDIPGNNPPVTFCFDITVGSCAADVLISDLSVDFSIWSDGDSGSWSQIGCNTGQERSIDLAGDCCGDITADADMDSIPDGCDDCPNSATGDSDGDGVCDDLDICPGSDDTLDADADGVPDGCDACPNSATGDSDGDGVCDDLDICPGSDDTLDADADNVPDGCDDCPNSATGDSDGDGVCDDLDICPGSDDTADTDGDGVPNGCDECPSSSTDDSDGDGVCDDADICPGSDDTLDADADGVPDGCDDCPNSATGDSDGDGVCDDLDICPGSDDTLDADADGVPDGCDDCPNSAIGDSDGDGVCDDLDVCPGSDDTADADGDDIPDGCDDCPNSATGDSDGDGVCDDLDICPGSDDTVDADEDGVPDGCDDCPNSETGDSDGDGVCDDADICPGSDDTVDADADGVPDGCDDCPNSATGDSDGDGVCDDLDICPGSDDTLDADADGEPDGCDDCPNSATGDSDGDGVCDDLDICPGSDDTLDADADGVPDGCDDCPNSDTGDSDGDGVCDDLDICPDGNDALDEDADGTPDSCDACPGSDDEIDIDEDGIPDGCDDTINDRDDTGIGLGPIIDGLYPNPTAGNINLVLSAEIEGTILVYDVYGRQVQQHEARGINRLQVDTNTLADGTYLIVVYSGAQELASKRFVKISR